MSSFRPAARPPHPAYLPRPCALLHPAFVLTTETSGLKTGGAVLRASIYVQKQERKQKGHAGSAGACTVRTLQEGPRTLLERARGRSREPTHFARHTQCFKPQEYKVARPRPRTRRGWGRARSRRAPRQSVAPPRSVLVKPPAGPPTGLPGQMFNAWSRFMPGFLADRASSPAPAPGGGGLRPSRRPRASPALGRRARSLTRPGAPPRGGPSPRRRPPGRRQRSGGQRGHRQTAASCQSTQCPAPRLRPRPGRARSR